MTSTIGFKRCTLSSEASTTLQTKHVDIKNNEKIALEGNYFTYILSNKFSGNKEIGRISNSNIVIQQG
jgi:hypothetical protein